VLFLEDQARLWLIVHLVLGVSLTAAATHQLVWMRGYLAGRFGRHRATRRFAWIVLALYAANFIVGNLIYPVYKVRVRVEYLENPAVAVAQRAVLDDARKAAGSDMAPAAPVDDQQVADTLASVSRWFDVKEHWIGLGFVLALANAFLMQAWNPRKHGAALAKPALAMTAAVAFATWAASLIGAVVTSYRSVGS